MRTEIARGAPDFRQEHDVPSNARIKFRPHALNYQMMLSVGSVCETNDSAWGSTRSRIPQHAAARSHTFLRRARTHSVQATMNVCVLLFV